jgi:hypothetical protein
MKENEPTLINEIPAFRQAVTKICRDSGHRYTLKSCLDCNPLPPV